MKENTRKKRANQTEDQTETQRENIRKRRANQTEDQIATQRVNDKDTKMKKSAAAAERKSEIDRVKSFRNAVRYGPIFTLKKGSLKLTKNLKPKFKLHVMKKIKTDSRRYSKVNLNQLNILFKLTLETEKEKPIGIFVIRARNI